MPKVKERNVFREKNRHGNYHWVYREPRRAGERAWGKRTQLPGQWGSPEWKAALDRARGFVSAAPLAKPAHNRADTLAWLSDKFQSSDFWKQTGPATRRHRRNLLRHLVEKNGDEPFRSISRKWVEELQSVAAFGEKEAPKAVPTKVQADALVKCLRVLFTWAVKAEHMQVNVARDVELLGSDNPDGFHPWSESEMAQFEATHARGALGRKAFDVLLNTGARISDAVNLGDANVEDGVIKFVPQKTRKSGTKVAIPMLPELAVALAACPSDGDTWIVGEKGGKMTEGSFGIWFRKLCDEAGLPQCSAHGLRKGAAHRLAKAGCTVDELKKWFGWTENRTPAVYTKEAEGEVLAANAAAKLLAARKGKKPVLRLVG